MCVTHIYKCYILYIYIYIYIYYYIFYLVLYIFYQFIILISNFLKLKKFFLNIIIIIKNI